MSEFRLDCRGLACPQPVLKCKQAIEENSPQRLLVTVDNEASRENVKRFLTTAGYMVSDEQKNSDFEISATGSGEVPAPEVKPEEYTCEIPQAAPGKQKICVFISSDKIGLGDDELGSRLMINFIATLPELGDDLWRIILVNNAVKLAVSGSPVAGKLRELEKSGVSILVCGTCLDFFDLLEQKQVGETTNMLDVVTSLQLAGKVIKI